MGRTLGEGGVLGIQSLPRPIGQTGSPSPMRPLGQAAPEPGSQSRDRAKNNKTVAADASLGARQEQFRSFPSQHLWVG